MKTTIELDEEKLRSVMELTGLKTKREAVDYALAITEKMAKVKRLLETPLYVTEGPVVDPHYDILALRERERPAA